jgi:hypothetical protein
MHGGRNVMGASKNLQLEGKSYHLILAIPSLPLLCEHVLFQVICAIWRLVIFSAVP